MKAKRVLGHTGKGGALADEGMALGPTNGGRSGCANDTNAYGC